MADLSDWSKVAIDVTSDPCLSARSLLSTPGASAFGTPILFKPYGDRQVPLVAPGTFLAMTGIDETLVHNSNRYLKNSACDGFMSKPYV